MKTRNGFVSTEYINFLLLSYGLGAIAILIYGNWVSRTAVVSLPIVFCSWAYWYDYRYMRFRIGDRVEVTNGMHSGKTGTVVESELLPYGARIEFDGNGLRPGEFPMGRDIRKIGAQARHDRQRSG